MTRGGRRPANSVTVNGYTYRWDSDDEQEDDRIFEIWEERDWLTWLGKHLRFPFQAQRMEDDEDWEPEDTDGKRETVAPPFSVGSIVTVTRLPAVNEDIDQDFEGILVDAECQGERGVVPLQDFEVVPPDDPNFGPVKEWVVHYANR